MAKPAAAPQTQAAPSQAGADLLVKDKPVMKPVDISISGTPHRIICPSDEVKNLEATADHINQKLRDIRKNIRGKTPTNEELLVLLCLDLHDQVQQLKHEVKSHEDSSSQALALIDKITKDARSVLK
ncbi:cell division protein ZapA [Moraxella caviae]|uniref:Cell division protein ZapA n=1 Tax=Moraxella caviae TaxID=34060 RepID=A0A1T0AAX9_9GAMM|nr:cell division protein ZapA [Moraxella caviae]